MAIHNCPDTHLKALRMPLPTNHNSIPILPLAATACGVLTFVLTTLCFLTVHHKKSSQSTQPVAAAPQCHLRSPA